jgi:hypothetical protein
LSEPLARTDMLCSNQEFFLSKDVVSPPEFFREIF